MQLTMTNSTFDLDFTAVVFNNVPFCTAPGSRLYGEVVLDRINMSSTKNRAFTTDPVFHYEGSMNFTLTNSLLNYYQRSTSALLYRITPGLSG